MDGNRGLLSGCGEMVQRAKSEREMTEITCLYVIIIVMLLFLIRQENKIRHLEKTFGEILSGHLLERLLDGLKDAMTPPQREEIKSASQETIDELSKMFEAIAKQEQKLKEEIKKRNENPNR